MITLYFTARINLYNANGQTTVRASDEIDFEGYYSETVTDNAFEKLIITKNYNTGTGYPVWHFDVPSLNGVICIFPKKNENADSNYYVAHNKILRTILGGPIGSFGLHPTESTADNASLSAVLMDEDGLYFEPDDSIKIPVRVNYDKAQSPNNLSEYDHNLQGETPVMKLENENGSNISLSLNQGGFYEIPSEFPWDFDSRYRLRLHKYENNTYPDEFMVFNPFNEWMTAQNVIFRLSCSIEDAQLSTAQIMLCPLSSIGFIDSSVIASIQCPRIINSEFYTFVECLDYEEVHKVDIAFVNDANRKYGIPSNCEIKYSATPLSDENGANNLFEKYETTIPTIATVPTVTSEEIIYEIPSYYCKQNAVYYNLYINEGYITDNNENRLKNISWEPVYNEGYNCERLSGNTFFATSINGGFKMAIPFIDNTVQLSGITISRHGYNSYFIPLGDFVYAADPRDTGLLEYRGVPIQLEPITKMGYTPIANQKEINDVVNNIYGHAPINENQPGVYNGTPFNNAYESNEYYPCVTENGTNLPLSCFQPKLDTEKFSSRLKTVDEWTPYTESDNYSDDIPLKDIEIAGLDGEFIYFSVKELRDTTDGIAYGLRYDNTTQVASDSLDSIAIQFPQAPDNRYLYFLSRIHDCKRTDEIQLYVSPDYTDEGVFFSLVDKEGKVISVANTATYDTYWFNLQDYFLYNKTVQATAGNFSPTEMVRQKIVCTLNDLTMMVKTPSAIPISNEWYGIKFILLESPLGDGTYKYDLYAYLVAEEKNAAYVNQIILNCDKFITDEAPLKQFTFVAAETTAIGKKARFLHSEIFNYQIKQIHPHIVEINKDPNPSVWPNLVNSENNPQGLVAFTFQWGIGKEDERYFIDIAHDGLVIMPTDSLHINKNAQDIVYNVYAKGSFTIVPDANWITVSTSAGKRGYNTIVCHASENTNNGRYAIIRFILNASSSIKTYTRPIIQAGQ